MLGLIVWVPSLDYKGQSLVLDEFWGCRKDSWRSEAQQGDFWLYKKLLYSRNQTEPLHLLWSRRFPCECWYEVSGKDHKVMIGVLLCVKWREELKGWWPCCTEVNFLLWWVQEQTFQMLNSVPVCEWGWGPQSRPLLAQAVLHPWGTFWALPGRSRWSSYFYCLPTASLVQSLVLNDLFHISSDLTNDLFLICETYSGIF